MFGSRAWGKAFKGDWDLGVWLNDVEKDVDLLHALAKHLRVREDNVELVVLNNYKCLSCTFVIYVLGRARPFITEIFTNASTSSRGPRSLASTSR